MREIKSEVPAAPANSRKNEKLSGFQLVVVSLLLVIVLLLGQIVRLMDERRMFLHERFVPTENDHGVCDDYVVLRSMPLDQTTCGRVLMKLLQLNNWV